MRSAFLLFVSASVVLSGVQSPTRMCYEETVANKFVSALLTDSVNNESLVDQFIIYRHDDNGKAFMLWYLDLVRNELRCRGISNANITILPFKNAKPELHAIDLLQDDKRHVYLVLHNDMFLFHLLMQDHRVFSMTVLDKGGRGFFMGY